jgi:chromatin assembly factor 1 subunit B
LSLNRHERTVNAVKFSPDGLHLLTAGDGGSIVVWSVPVSKRGNDNGRHYWSTLERENELTCRVVSGASEDILDVSWSADSKRFVVGSLDHCVMVYEDAACHAGSEESQWTCVYRNAKDHTHYVQGVSYDPLGVYVASMGSDRTARVYARKQPSALKTPKKKKNHNGPTTTMEERALAPSNIVNEPQPPPSMEDKEQEELRKRDTVQRVLTESKFELGKAKTLKYRYDATGDASVEATNTNNNTTMNSGKKHHLFADETTVESFFRRLSWTTDGAFLVAPAALWHGHGSANVVNGNEAKPEHEGTTGGTVSSPTFATYLFARHRFDKPIRVLAGLEKVRRHQSKQSIHIAFFHDETYLLLLFLTIIQYCFVICR